MRGRSLATVVILVVLVVATHQASDCCVPFPLAQKQATSARPVFSSQDSTELLVCHLQGSKKKN